MNNTITRTLALVAVFIAATLVVGTLATMATSTQSAYAYAKKLPRQDDNKKTRDNGSGNGNDNTVTIEDCKNRGSASGFDTKTNQECENLICPHPGENATCTQEGVISTLPTPTPTKTPTSIQVSGQGEGETFCPGSPIPIPLITSITFSVKQSGSAEVQGQFEVFVGPGFTKTGTLDSVQITGNSFTITGTELSQGPIAHCGSAQLPSSATMTGQCGTGETIQFATADGEHATFTGNVECTTT